MKKKLIRISTVPLSLMELLRGQLGFMSQYYDVLGIASPGKEMELVKENENINTLEVKMTRTISPLKDLKACYLLYRIFKKEKPYIVHTHTPKAGTVGMLAAKLAGVPHRLHTVAGLPLLEAKGKKRRLLNLVEKITYSSATKIYPNSFGLKNIILSEKFCKADKLKVIANGSSNGINTNWFDPNLISKSQLEKLKKSLFITNEDFVFIFVGRLVRDKGINELIEAFKKINIQFSETKLLLVGTYEKKLSPLMPSTLIEIEKNPNIITVGYQKDVRPYFAIANTLAFPSYREGFPNVVMQAGAMGLPSIVTNINGCNEIIQDNINGLIIPPKDTKSMYYAMARLLTEKQLLKAMIQNARKMIISRYEQQMVWSYILKEYISLRGE